jgi:hypothetical protein
MMLGLSRRIVSLCGVAGFLFGIFVAAAQDRDGVEAKTDHAHVVVYRVVHGTGGYGPIKPSVYCDDKEVALMYSGRYFIVALSPGKHKISSSNKNKAVSLDAKPGVTLYVRVVSVNGVFVNNTFGVEQVDANTALKEIERLKPADPSHVLAPEIVSISAIPGN